MGFVFSFLTLFLAMHAWAWPPTFGTEYNFSSGEMNAAWQERGAKVKFKGMAWQQPSPTTIEQTQANRMITEIQSACADCEITPHIGKWRNIEYDVKSPKGYHFNVSIDPACVEVQTFPENTAELSQHESEAQSLIFEAAHRAGMKGEGAAHLNIGLASAFDDDAKSFLRFFTNYHNLPELSSGALGKDHFNAPLLSQLSPGQKKAFRKLLSQVNSGKITSAKTLASLLQRQVYTKTPFVEKGGGHHYQGISVKQINKPGAVGDQPFELRGLLQPRNAHERTLLAELLEKRMAFEKSQTGPVIFYDQHVPSDLSPRSRGRKSYHPAELRSALMLYAEDAGAKFEDYEPLLPLTARHSQPDRLMAGTLNFRWAGDLDLWNRYVPALAFSPSVRERMAKTLENPAVRASPEMAQALKAIRDMRASAGSDAQQIFADFLKQVDPAGEKTFWGTCAAFFQRVAPAGH